ncbi:NUDIX domain-containing protein [Candidatus Woesearchaeota archaeon]|nr:NUDIX domain-containing protein [Candidatus Woesearchaeota archaeon]
MEQVFTDRKGNKVIKPKSREVLNRISAYGIARQGNKILLVNPTWKKEFELPGGAVENEKITDGLKREFLEETGYTIEIISDSPINTRFTLFYADDIDTFFISKLLFFSVKVAGENESSLVNKKEINQSRWYDLEKLNENNTQINTLHLDVIMMMEK